MTGQSTGVVAQQLKMLSIENCKKILKENGATYNDEQVKEIRDLLYKLGRIDYLNYQQVKLKENEKSNHLHKG